MMSNLGCTAQLMGLFKLAVVAESTSGFTVTGDAVNHFLPFLYFEISQGIPSLITAHQSTIVLDFLSSSILAFPVQFLVALPETDSLHKFG